MAGRWEGDLIRQRASLIAKKREKIGVAAVSLMIGLYGHLQVKDELLTNFNNESLVYYFAMIIAVGGLIYAVTTYADASKQLNATEKALESKDRSL